MNILPETDRIQLNEALRSGEPERVSWALETLDQAWRQRRFGSLPMPEPDCLDAFGEHVPIKILSHYLSVLRHYPDFEPTPAGDDLRHALIEAVVRYGRGEETLEVALAIRTDAFPEHAVADGLGYLRDRGLNNSPEVLAAQRLVSHLLDAKTTREATIDLLRSCVLMDCLPEVITAITPQLDEKERARISINEED